MKFTTSVCGTLAVLGAVVAQDSGSLPNCGQTCMNNLQGSAGDFGCSGADAACLCSNATFTYGIRDCSNESCPDSSAASSVIQYGIDYCASAGVVIPTGVETVTSGSVVPTVTSSGGAGDTTGASSAIATSSYEVTLTTDGTTLTTSLPTTIYGGGAAGSAASSVASGVSSVESSGSSVVSSIEASVTSAVASATSSIRSAASSAASAATGSETSSSTAFAPHVTAAPVGFLAAAGIAAMLL